jgi:hypothetical protein
VGRVVVTGARVTAGDRRVVGPGRGRVVLGGAELVVGAAVVVGAGAGPEAGAGEDVVVRAGVVVLPSGTVSGTAPCRTVEPGGGGGRRWRRGSALEAGGIGEYAFTWS